MITIPSTQLGAFTVDACAEIEQSHVDAWNDITAGKLTRSQYEAQFVARLCAGAGGIAAKWRPRIRAINPSLSLSFASVFTHQSPYVEWPPATHANRCELADLLIAIIDRTSPPGHGHAVLIQAKQSDSGAVRLTTASEKDQFDLLSGRPTFDVDASAPAPGGINLAGLYPDDSLQYGLTPPDATPATPSAWKRHRWTMVDGLRSSSGSYRVSGSACLAEWLVEQLQGNRGWAFDLPPSGKDWSWFSAAPRRDDWSALINYLLEATFKKPLKQLALGGTPPDRGLDEPLCLINRSPSGKLMFELSEGHRHPAPVGEVEHQWLRDLVPWTALWSGHGGGDGGDGVVRPAPDNGPISTIVFQIDKRQD